MSLRFTVVFLTTSDAPIHKEAEDIVNEVANIKHMHSDKLMIDKELITEIKDIDAILVKAGRVTREVMDIAKNLRVIAIHDTDVDQVDVAAATDKGIVVTNTPFAKSTSVAEFTFGLILSLTRRIPMVSMSMKNKGWTRVKLNKELWIGTELFGKTLGVVGIGNVGRRFVKRARAFGMNVLACDPYVPIEVAEEQGATMVDLNTILRKSDFITLHVTLTPDTRHMIGEKELKIMKRTAYLINTCRGSVVEEKALYRSLKEGWIMGAALDVMEEEPTELDNPLFTLNNIIITPHIAGITSESNYRMATTAARDIVRVLKGQRPVFPVNSEVL